jgi:4-hydroxy-tetrahydrodipicolinate synthase
MPDPIFRGSGVALVTPFDDDGVAEDPLRSLVDYHLDAGTDALVVCGSTGEAVTMSADEQRRAAEVVVERAAGRVPVVVGAGGSDTRAVSGLARAAAAAGADGLLVAPPPYNKPTQAGMEAHFRAVMDAADLPTILYNVPGRTACNLLPATVERLADDPRVAGVKEASGDISQVADLCRRVADRMAVYSGNDDQVVPLMALGGVGVISVLANIAPAEVSRMAHAFLDGDTAGAREIQLRFLPLIATLFAEPNPVPVKAAVAELGFAVGPVRLPLVPLTDGGREALLREMRAVGIEPTRQSAHG